MANLHNFLAPSTWSPLLAGRVLPTTVTDYRRAVLDFVRFVNEEGGRFRSPQEVDRWLVDYGTQGYIEGALTKSVFRRPFTVLSISSLR